MAFKEKEIKDAENKAKNLLEIPAGYTEIRLSTEGKINCAPASFHVRNFTTEDLMNMATTDQAEIPVQVMKILQEIIYEKDVDIKKFHENEVIETLFIIFRDFFSSILTDIPWELTDEDKDFLAAEHGGKQSPEYLNRIASYEDGSWVPRWDIDLESFSFYKIPDDFKSVVEAKFNDTTVEFSMPRYGDVLILKKLLDVYFKEEENKYRQISQNIQEKARLKKMFAEGKSNNDGSRIYIPKTEEDAYNEYSKRRLIFSATAVKALHLKSLNGKNLENLDLSERIKIVEENPAIFSHGVFKQVTKMFADMKIGINPETKGKDPITGRITDVRYTFRVFTLLQAIRDNDNNKVTLTLK